MTDDLKTYILHTQGVLNEQQNKTLLDNIRDLATAKNLSAELGRTAACLTFVQVECSDALAAEISAAQFPGVKSVNAPKFDSAMIKPVNVRPADESDINRPVRRPRGPAP